MTSKVNIKNNQNNHHSSYLAYDPMVLMQISPAKLDELLKKLHNPKQKELDLNR